MCFYLRYGCHAHSHVCNKIEKGFIWIYVELVVDILNATLLIWQILNIYNFYWSTRWFTSLGNVCTKTIHSAASVVKIPILDTFTWTFVGTLNNFINLSKVFWGVKKVNLRYLLLSTDKRQPHHTMWLGCGIWKPVK